MAKQKRRTWNIFSTFNEEQPSDEDLDFDLEDDNDQRDIKKIFGVYQFGKKH